MADCKTLRGDWQKTLNRHTASFEFGVHDDSNNPLESVCTYMENM